MKRIPVLLMVLFLSGNCFAGAVAQWKMNDDASDAVVVDSIGSHTGTYVDENGAAAVTSDHAVAGHINGGLEFDGTNDYITVSDHNDFTFIGTPFSVTAWVTLGVDAAAEFDITSKFETNQMEWSLYISGDALYFTLWDNINGGNRGRKDTADYSAWEDSGIYIFIVGTYSGTGDLSGLKVYLDGERVDDANESNSTFSAMVNTTSSIYIGFRHGSANKAIGEIDNVVIYDTELTQAQINSLYNNGTGTESVGVSVNTLRQRARGRER